MKTLTIRWQRLINETGQTCDRCRDTGGTIETAFKKLQKALAELGIKTKLESKTIDLKAFRKDPLQSNRIWIRKTLGRMDWSYCWSKPMLQCLW